MQTICKRRWMYTYRRLGSPISYNRVNSYDHNLNSHSLLPYICKIGLSLLSKASSTMRVLAERSLIGTYIYSKYVKPDISTTSARERSHYWTRLRPWIIIGIPHVYWNWITYWLSNRGIILISHKEQSLKCSVEFRELCFFDWCSHLNHRK